MTGSTGIERRLRISDILIVEGLSVEGPSLIRIHPLAFLGFMFIGGTSLLTLCSCRIFAIG
jgi:hypothetical protein